MLLKTEMKLDKPLYEKKIFTNDILEGFVNGKIERRMPEIIMEKRKYAEEIKTCNGNFIKTG